MSIRNCWTRRRADGVPWHAFAPGAGRRLRNSAPAWSSKKVVQSKWLRAKIRPLPEEMRGTRWPCGWNKIQTRSLLRRWYLAQAASMPRARAALAALPQYTDKPIAALWLVLFQIAWAPLDIFRFADRLPQGPTSGVRSPWP